MKPKDAEEIANRYLSQPHIGPQSLAVLIWNVYHNGVMDEKLGDWGEARVPKGVTMAQITAEVEAGMKAVNFEPVEFEVQIESGNPSPQGSPYQATINEFTKNPIRR